MSFSAVYFDCDSTLSRIEGINELARVLDPPRRAELEELTDRAMNGEAPLDEVYGRRLAMVTPTREDVERIGRVYVEEAVPHTREVVAALQAAGKIVGIVSGGLRPAVAILARHLGVADEHVHAVDIEFDADGRYRDFDRDSPLSRNGGKTEVLRGVDVRPLAFVGDGVTDLEARDVVDLFVGFGGVVHRKAVADAAEVYIDEPDLRPLLDIVLTKRERADS